VEDIETLKPCTTLSGEEAEEMGWKVARRRRLRGGNSEWPPNQIGFGGWLTSLLELLGYGIMGALDGWNLAI
jgi:hypothetical protein